MYPNIQTSIHSANEPTHDHTLHCALVPMASTLGKGSITETSSPHFCTAFQSMGTGKSVISVCVVTSKQGTLHDRRTYLCLQNLIKNW